MKRVGLVLPLPASGCILTYQPRSFGECPMMGTAMKHVMRFRSIGLLLAVGFACLLSAACAPLSRSAAVPVGLEDQATIPGMSDIRYWGDADTPAFAKDALESRT